MTLARAADGPNQLPVTQQTVTVAEALRQFAPEYLAKFGNRVPLGHRKVLGLIQRCGTGKLGHAFYRCGDCRRLHVMKMKWSLESLSNTIRGSNQLIGSSVIS